MASWIRGNRGRGYNVGNTELPEKPAATPEAMAATQNMATGGNYSTNVGEARGLSKAGTMTMGGNYSMNLGEARAMPPTQSVTTGGNYSMNVGTAPVVTEPRRPEQRPAQQSSGRFLSSNRPNTSPPPPAASPPGSEYSVQPAAAPLDRGKPPAASLQVPAPRGSPPQPLNRGPLASPSRSAGRSGSSMGFLRLGGLLSPPTSNPEAAPTPGGASSSRPSAAPRGPATPTRQTSPPEGGVGTEPGDLNLWVKDRAGRLQLLGRCNQLPTDIAMDYEVTSRVLGVSSMECGSPVLLAQLRGATAFQNGRLAAVKSLDFGKANDGQRQAMEMELRVLSCVDHPNIVRLLEIYELPDRSSVKLVTEFLSGGELFDRLLEMQRMRGLASGLPEREASNVTRQLLQALGYLHGRGIVHRDVRPENVLYARRTAGADNENVKVKLIDFGFSTFCTEGEVLTEKRGTLEYVAPEVLRGGYGCQCDLWSLGVLLYVVLAGRLPWSAAAANGGGSSAADLSLRITSGAYDLAAAPWPSISRQAQGLTRALLTLDPFNRPTPKQALQATPWLQRGAESRHPPVLPSIISALKAFPARPRIQRAIMTMTAWALSDEELDVIGDLFLSLDVDCSGAISVGRLQRMLAEAGEVRERDASRIFLSLKALGVVADNEIHFTEFVAAMISTYITPSEDALRSAFRHFDPERFGRISEEGLRRVLGDRFQGRSMTDLLQEGDFFGEGAITMDGFLACLQGVRNDPPDTGGSLHNGQLSPNESQLLASTTASELDRSSEGSATI